MFVDQLEITRDGFRTSREDGQMGVAQPARTFSELAPLLGDLARLAAGVRLRDVLLAVDLGAETVLLDLVVGQTVEPFLRRMQDQRRAVGPKPKSILIRNSLLSAQRGSDVVQVLQREVVVEGDRGMILDLGAFPLERLLDAPLRYEPTLAWPQPSATTADAQSPGRRGRGVGLPTPRTVAPPPAIALGLSLVELLQAIFWELSFHGTPAERDAAAAALEGALPPAPAVPIVPAAILKRRAADHRVSVPGGAAPSKREAPPRSRKAQAPTAATKKRR